MAGIDTEQRIARRNLNFLSNDRESAQKNSEKFSVELRKNKRLEIWNKSRRKMFPNPEKPENFQEILEKILKIEPGQDNSLVLEALKKNFMEKDKEFVNEAHLGTLMNLLKGESEDNQVRILDFLINFTYVCVEFCSYLVKIGIFLVISEFFYKVEKEVCKNAIWLVTNLVNGSNELKAKMVCNGFLDGLVEMIKTQRLSEDTLTVVLWSFSAFGKYICRMDKQKLNELVLILATYTTDSNSDHSSFSTHALFNILNTNDSFISQLISSNTIPPMLQNLSLTPCRVLYFHLKLLGSLLSSYSSKPTDYLISQNLLPELFNCLSHPKEKIRSEAFFCFSNIAAGTLSQKSLLINQQMLTCCILSLQDSYSVSQEACQVLKNLAFDLTPTQCEQILSFGSLHELCPVLHHTVGFFPHTKKLFVFFEQILGKICEENLEQLKNSGFFLQLSELEYVKGCEISGRFKVFLDSWIN